MTPLMRRSRWSNGANELFMRVQRQPLHLVEAEAERVATAAANSDDMETPLISRLSVLTVTRKRSRRSRSIGMLLDGRHGARVDVGGRAHLERHAPVADVARQPAQRDVPVRARP